MNDRAWYDYINQLHQHIMEQDKKIQNLTERIDQLEYQQPNKGQQTTIEKLEYHFDQLKIERMDGTLHIGLSPEDLTKMDNFSLPLRNQPSNQPYQQLIRNLEEFIDQDGPAMLQRFENEFQSPLDDTKKNLIIQDIRKQLPTRVTYYEKEAKQQGIANQQLEKYIYQQIQTEIDHSLRQFFKNQGE